MEGPHRIVLHDGTILDGDVDQVYAMDHEDRVHLRFADGSDRTLSAGDISAATNRRGKSYRFHGMHVALMEPIPETEVTELLWAHMDKFHLGKPSFPDAEGTVEPVALDPRLEAGYRREYGEPAEKTEEKPKPEAVPTDNPEDNSESILEEMKEGAVELSSKLAMVTSVTTGEDTDEEDEKLSKSETEAETTTRRQRQKANARQATETEVQTE